ncbi:MAG TPA: endo-1,4-beta-xylanase [Ktedonobacteraceae bacterium]|nr:endo-1,4-beta-xylanase [Ktedonobacteraceae bacterium]
MFRRLGRKKLFVIPLGVLLLSLCLSAVVLHSASAAASTLAQAGAQSGRGIGVAVEANLLGNNAYTTIAQTQFDVVTPGNEMKWQTTEPSQGQFNFGPADQIVSFAQQHSMKIRGHTLVWYSQLANWVNSVPSSQILSVMNNHITTEMTHFKGKIWYWDVVNEAFNEDGSRRSDVFQNEIGNAYIEDAFRTARAADSNAKLCYNDYNIEDMNSAKSQAVYAMVADFKNRGVPIDCVGFQSHFIVGQVPADFQATLQKFANLGIDVQITELDDRMQTPASQANLNQQATDYANVAKACLAVSRCNDITIWGVGEPDSWIPSTFSGQGQALLYDSNYQPKAAYTSFLNALSGSAATPPPATPTHAPTSTPTGVPTTPTTNPGGGSCSVHYAVTNQWPGGFGVNVTIANTGSSTINGWTLAWTFANGQTITQIWNASASQSGGSVRATNLSYDATIAPGGNISFGFNGAWNGSNTSPTSFTLNGSACSNA